MQRKLHQTVQRLTEDFGGRWHFNTSIAAVMELTNELYAYEDSVRRGENPHPSKTGSDGAPSRATTMLRVEDGPPAHSW